MALAMKENSITRHQIGWFGWYVGRAVSLGMCMLLMGSGVFGLGQEQYVETNDRPGNFVLVKDKRAARLYVDANDYPGVVRAVGDLQSDIQKVTNCTLEIEHGVEVLGSSVVLVGTLGKSAVIDQLAREGKLDTGAIAGKWESFTIQTVANPLPGVASALVIVGSDKRGTIYGIYDMSEEIGVSPWYWWADVPVAHHDVLSVKPGIYTQGPPAVKYRGIFLNDEAPALTGWVKEKYGNYNHEFYTKVFELILRLKGNYLWPAMWNNAFSDDDPLNPKLADEYGIVMGTSHHEPMMRAQKEWTRHGSGPWDYSKNGEYLREFWEQGLSRNKDYENVVTVGMRGDGDLPMTESANISLLEEIVTSQRKIIGDVYHRDPDSVPQDWALYKEVQEYYEKGMRVPDDITLLWCDDNWGNIRRLPTAQERKRAGGAGIYYHFDYVGDPRSYKWINTNPLPKIWEQMNLALHYGAERIWIVNVGDLKPMEFPIEFFLSLAWDPARWPKEKIGEFGRLWAAREFGPEHAAEIADIVSKYGKYNGRRKPELLEPNTYSVVNYREADTAAADFQEIVDKAEAIYAKLPAEKKDAFYELVLYPANASAVVTQLYVTVGKDQLYAKQGRVSTNTLAEKAHALFQEDAELASHYNHVVANGKWNHMMDQTHIGYTFWNEPSVNAMPNVTTLEIPATANMGVAVEGSQLVWPGASVAASLPLFDVFNQQRFYVDVFNRGKTSFGFTAVSTAPWIVVSETEGRVEEEKRIWMSVDWRKALEDRQNGLVKIVSDAGQSVEVKIEAFRPASPVAGDLQEFVEGDGYVSMEAVHFTKNVVGDAARWEKIDDLGRTLSAMTIFPVTAQSILLGQKAPCLEYRMYLFHSGQVTVDAIIDPTLNFVPGRGLRYAISLDDEPPQVVDVLAEDSKEKWETSVKDGVRIGISKHTVKDVGYHTLKFWMVDPGVVLQKLVVDVGGVKPSYLGPPESYRVMP
jgi:hypothetical protein